VHNIPNGIVKRSKKTSKKKTQGVASETGQVMTKKFLLTGTRHKSPQANGGEKKNHKHLKQTRRRTRWGGEGNLRRISMTKNGEERAGEVIVETYKKETVKHRCRGRT